MKSPRDPAKVYANNKRYREKKKATGNNSLKIHSQNWAWRNRLKVRYSALKHRTKGQDILSRDEFIEWFTAQEKVCFYCGVPRSVLATNPMGNSATARYLHIDRKDNDLGYLKDNIVLACGICNVTKSNIFTSAEMLEIASRYIAPKYKAILENDRA